MSEPCWLTRPAWSAAEAARPDDLCAACSVPRKHHGEDGRAKHWFVAPRAAAASSPVAQTPNDEDELEEATS